MIKARGLSPSLNTNCSNIHVELEFEEDEEGEDDQIRMVIEFANRLDEPKAPLEAFQGDFKKRYLCYIAGYVCHKMKVTCGVCQAALLDSPEDPLEKQFARLIQMKNRGGLKTPSKRVFQIVQKAETFF